MMDKKEQLRALRELLEEIPGVRVTWFYIKPGFLHLVLYMDSHEALVCVTTACGAANTRLGVERADSYKNMVPAPGEDELRYVIHVDYENVAALGFLLVRELGKRGWMGARKIRTWRALWTKLDRQIQSLGQGEE
jgi:hypothetical protein